MSLVGRSFDVVISYAPAKDRAASASCENCLADSCCCTLSKALLPPLHLCDPGSLPITAGTPLTPCDSSLHPAQILKLLRESQGNILDDEQLINTLNHSKLTSSVIGVRSKTQAMQLL